MSLVLFAKQYLRQLEALPIVRPWIWETDAEAAVQRVIRFQQYEQEKQQRLQDQGNQKQNEDNVTATPGASASFSLTDNLPDKMNASAAPFVITVKSIKKDSSMTPQTFKIAATDTLLSFKCILQSTFGIDPTCQRLIYKGRALTDDTKTMDELALDKSRVVLIHLMEKPSVAETMGAKMPSPVEPALPQLPQLPATPVSADTLEPQRTEKCVDSSDRPLWPELFQLLSKHFGQASEDELWETLIAARQSRKST